ncbi:MAG TPA: 4a-hydroxytetrahydrobiopterin dehydratase [Candidatus Binatia bacterium]|jgi:4a-hydroxytetrahydrobiopterin dehydratase|nr:4a-hydroxytetrahydrobiopterin dehydratase [Candidatus Binatia bacterium]
MDEQDGQACDLASKRCGPCNKETPPLDAGRCGELHVLVPEWEMGQGRITREFRFRDFKEAMAFANRVGDVAEGEGHHPDIFVNRWRYVHLTLTTHAIGGLSENDFIVAAKIDRLP